MGSGNPTVEDKIVNFLELESNSSIDQSYLSAIIEQRTKSLSQQNLLATLTPKRLIKAAWIAGIPTFIVFVIGLFDSDLITQGSFRFLDYNTAYVPMAPFQFESEMSWEVEYGEPLTLKLYLNGNRIPDRAFVYLNGERIAMTTVSPGEFEWTIDRNVENSSVVFEALEFKSEKGIINVLKVPSLLNFKLRVLPPSYTGIAPFEIEASGDAVVPVGSDVLWTMQWRDADSISLLDSKGGVLEDVSVHTSSSSASIRLLSPLKYRVAADNVNGTQYISGLYDLSIIPDLPPSVEVEYRVDSITRRVYVRGYSSDDYGVTSTRIVLEGDSSYVIPVGSQNTWTSSFQAESRFHSFSVEVYDNDGVHGNKRTKVGPFELVLPSQLDRREELDKQDHERVEELKEFRREQSEMRELQEEMNRQLIDGNSNWQQNQMKQRMLRQQEQLMENWDRMMNQFRRENEQRMMNDPSNPENTEKREELQRLMDEMDKDKLEELMKEMEERSERMNQDNLRDWMRRVQNENDRMELDAKRLEELMKRLAFEQDLDRAMEELNEMQERQQDLANRTDDTREEQDELNEQFEDWKNNLDSLQKQNSELEHPNDFDSPKEEAEKTEESMQKSSDELNQNQSDKANEKQQQSSDQMQDMMQQMSSTVMQMQMQQHVENLAVLRRILTNLIHLSDDQEQLGSEILSNSSSDAVVVAWMKRQQDLRKGYQVVDDSLSALIGRIPQIEAPVTKWMVEVKSNMTQSNDDLSERDLPSGSSNMRESMIALNELSLMLDGTMDQIQQQMSGMMKGDQSCQKPGGGKPSMSNMRKMQQQLNQQMQQMGMQQGNQPQRDGQNGQSGEGGENGMGEGMSEELVEMMMRQAEIRQMLNEAGSTGNNGNKALEELLEENERDLARQNFDAEFFERQKEIDVKMLELEEAERLQEQDEERKSNAGDRYQELLRMREEEFLRDQKQMNEQLRYQAPPLTPYYRQRSGSYLRGQ
ncbi:hypothetical protein GCM10011318_10350 [Phaeocystidibacter marisrubri]|nr:hypothetical protein GCM10011318_10350 [Phaeocystidibacter marisrubri]